MKFLTPASAIEEFFYSQFLLTSSAKVGILVGVSGGPDSIALLHALHTYNSSKGNLEIQVAHFEHQIRGGESVENASFVQKFCEALGIPCFLGTYNVPEFARKESLSLEDAARQVRFAFFGSLLSRSGFPLLLLGHQAGDNAETIMLRLLRGTGPQGLSGIAMLAPFPPPVTKLAGIFEQDYSFLKRSKIGRPFLKVWRRELENYCREHHLETREDETNRELKYTRNRVRLELLPFIESRFKPDFQSRLVQMSELVRADQVWLDALTAEAFEKFASFPGPQKVEFEKGNFEAQPLALQRRLLRKAYFELKGSLQNLEAADLETLLGSQQLVKDLPGGIQAYKTRSKIGLRILPQSSPPLPPVTFQVPGKVIFGHWVLESSVQENNQTNLLKSSGPFTAFLDYSITGPLLLVRSRKAGDRFKRLGAPGRTKVKDIMPAAGLARELRNSWPLVTKPSFENPGENPGEGALEKGVEEIVWLPGDTISDKFKVTPATRRILVLKLKDSLEDSRND